MYSLQAKRNRLVKTYGNGDASMRIGLAGGASSIDKIVAQAQRAEADGFHSL